MKARLVQIGFALCALIVSVPVFATSQRTFVASNGNDGNPCSLPLPCRTFAFAVAQTISGGEVVVLDSAGYGPVTIAQSVSIIAPPGVYAGISVGSGNGVTIGTAGVAVTLRGLTINGVGGANGILMTDGLRLSVENCTVAGFDATDNVAAINISALATVVISNTVVTKSNVGIVLDGGAHADISNVKAVNNSQHGIAMVGPSNSTTVAVVSNSIASGHAYVGFTVAGSGVGTAGFGACAGCTRKMTLSNSEASNNNVGMNVSGVGAIMNVTNSVATNNRVNGFYQDLGGTFRSGQNNVLTDNLSGPTFGSITPGGFFY